MKLRNITDSRILLPLSLFISLGLLFIPTVKNIAVICWNYEDYSHGLLLPFMTFYLLWIRREDILARANASCPLQKSFSWLGAFLYLFGLLIFFIGKLEESFFSSWVGIFPTTLGALLLVFGKEITALVAGPILINFMAKPLPDSLLPQLLNPFQTFAASVSAWVLEMLRVPVYAMGNVIEIPGMRLLVEQACSGMRSLISLLTVSFIVICLMDFSWLGSLLIVAVAIVTAVALNVTRVAVTGILAHFVDPVTATGFFHTFAGMIVFLVGLAILFSVGRLLERKKENKGL